MAPIKPKPYRRDVAFGPDFDRGRIIETWYPGGAKVTVWYPGELYDKAPDRHEEIPIWPDLRR